MTLCAVGIAIKFALVVHCQGIKAAKVFFCVVTIINDFYVVMMARPVKRIYTYLLIRLFWHLKSDQYVNFEQKLNLDQQD